MLRIHVVFIVVRMAEGVLQWRIKCEALRTALEKPVGLVSLQPLYAFCHLLSELSSYFLRYRWLGPSFRIATIVPFKVFIATITVPYNIITI